MQLKKSHLLADIALEQVSAALSAWSWLLEGGKWSPLFVSAAGDIFLAKSDGVVFRLDAGMGELERVAETVAIFEQSLNDLSLARDWLLEPVVEKLRADGRVLGSGQCYGFTVLPVFEKGSYKADNRSCRQS